MRIENHYGKNIVCGHIFPPEEIEIGSEWQDSTGCCVKVIAKQEINHEYNGKINKATWISYSRHEKGAVKTHEKDSFSFQCRYCLMIKDETN